MNDKSQISRGRPKGAGRFRLLAVSLLLTTVPAFAKPGQAEANSLAALDGIVIALALFALTGTGIAALVLWGRKQDQIGEMALFGMRYLLDFERAPEACNAAKQLGRSGDPEAFLVLLDVFQDEATPDPVRRAAGEALAEMNRRSRKLAKVIEAARSAGEKGDHNELIRVLTEHFERDGKGYVQSAYLIGRAYLRLDHVADAKEWFRVAERRNRKAALYGGRIHTLIDESNQRLFGIGDEQFASGDYHAARERYAAASHGLSGDESKRNSAFLRLACAYCMLGAYHDAEQALLQALQHGHNTDSALALSQLLQRILDRQTPPSTEEHHRLKARIRGETMAVMGKIGALPPRPGG